MLRTDYNLPTADINPTVKQLIATAVTSAITAVIDVIDLKHKEQMLVLREMIKKSLLLRDFFSSNPSSNPDVAPKAHPATDSLSKASTKR